MLDKIKLTEKVTLKEIRKLEGMSQQIFAEKVQIPFSTYRRYENNPLKMEVGQLFKICEVTGIPLEKIKM